MVVSIKIRNVGLVFIINKKFNSLHGQNNQIINIYPIKEKEIEFYNKT